MTSNNDNIPVNTSHFSARHKTRIIIAISLIFSILLLKTSDLTSAITESISENTNLTALTHIDVDSIEQLERIFELEDYSWPSSTIIPAIAINSIPEGLNTLDPSRKKSLFFRIMLPLVKSENIRISMQRQYLIKILRNKQVSESDIKQLKTIADEYNIELKHGDNDSYNELLSRVDIIPTSLVIAQAANESGWGTSRFALQGQALFGEWTYNSNSGIKPIAADDNSTHRVRSFPRLIDSVRSYMHNINTSDAYNELRKIRRESRENGIRPTGYDLSAGLLNYSEQGITYINAIRNIILHNNLAILKNIELRKAEKI